MAPNRRAAHRSRSRGALVQPAFEDISTAAVRDLAATAMLGTLRRLPADSRAKSAATDMALCMQMLFHKTGIDRTLRAYG